MNFTSKYLSPAAVRGMNKVGDVLCPGEGEFPTFSALGCVEHVDIPLEYAPEADVKDLGLLLAILSFAPTFVVRWLVQQMAVSHDREGGLWPTFRQLDFGLRGIVFGLYYGGRVGRSYTGPNPHQLVGFSIERLED